MTQVFSHTWRLLFGRPALTAIQIIFLIEAVGRGIDYAYPAGVTPLTLATVEQAAPIRWWGIALTACVIAIVIAQIAHRPALAVVGEVLLGALLLALGGSLFLATATEPYMDGFRTGLTLICVGATHIAIAYAVARNNMLWRWANAPAAG